MANITLLGASYTDVPAIDLPQTGGGTVRFYENGGTPSGPTYETYFDGSITAENKEISIASLADLYFAEGETWRVTWDGTEYTCQTAIYEGWLWTIGNQTLSAKTDDGTGEPFCLYNYGGGALNGDSRTAGTHTLKLERQTSSGGGGSSDNPLSGKIATFTGDSVCAGYGYTGGYAGIIGSENNMTVENLGTGDGCIAPYSDKFVISTSIANMRSDADFVILEGGANDAGYEVPLGSLTSGYNDTLNTSTFAGAFENMLKSAIAKFPSAKIGYIFIHKCEPNFDSRTTGSYYNIAKAACEKWGIPICDLNVCVPPLGYIADLTSTYLVDAFHPNELGYRTFYVPKITAFMKSMLTDYSLISKTITENGTYLASDDGADGYNSVTVNVQSGGGTPPNVQTAQSTTRRNNTALGSITSLTCSTAGTYDVYWACARSNTSQTWGSQLYINGTAYGTENTTWTNHVQNNHLTGVVLSANATVAVYGRSRSGYYIYAPQLTIVQTA